MKKILSIVALALCVMMMGGCVYGGILTRKVRTSGSSETREFDMDGFTGLTLKGNMERVYVELENGDYNVEIDADKNYFKELEVDMRGDNLRIGVDDSRRLSEPIYIRITAPELDSMDIQGGMGLSSTGVLAGDTIDINIEGAVEAELDMEYNSINMRIAGAAEADLYGETEDLTITCEGAADVNAKRLTAKNAKVSIAGAGDIKLHCTDYLDASIEGAGEIEYSGNPEVKKHVAGLGSIKQDN